MKAVVDCKMVRVRVRVICLGGGGNNRLVPRFVSKIFGLLYIFIFVFEFVCKTLGLRRNLLNLCLGFILRVVWVCSFALT